MKVFLLCLVVAFVTIEATTRDTIKTEQVFGKTVKFCSYKGLRLLPKSTIKDYDECTKCTCSKNGLRCDILISACTIKYPDDSKCDNVRIGCVNTWVMKSNQKKKCPKPLIPKEGVRIVC